MALPPGTLARLPPESRAKLATPLSAEHTTALRTMFTAGLLRPLLDPETAGALVAAGYAREGTGGLMLTDEGAARALLEGS